MAAAAAESSNPYFQAFANYLTARFLILLRDYGPTEQAAASGLEISEKNAFPQMAAYSRLLLGAARASTGRDVEGIRLIRQGIEELRKMCCPMGGWNLALAQALEFGGATAEALGAIEQALESSFEEVLYRSETLRTRGELRLKISEPELAEKDFREAIAVARNMGAKAWELRATTSLARLLASRGEGTEARSLLAEIYNWFTEGFDTADLRDAKAVLDELSD
jgi:hypothetical protein